MSDKTFILHDPHLVFFYACCHTFEGVKRIQDCKTPNRRQSYSTFTSGSLMASLSTLLAENSLLHTPKYNFSS